MRYFTSDTHFFHENMLKWSGRSYNTVEDMHREIQCVWNLVVPKDEVIYSLGDYSFKPNQKAEEIKRLTKELNGRKIGIIGNHDTREGLLSFGFDTVCDNAYIEIDGIQFKLAHFPHRGGMTEYDQEERQDCFTEKMKNRKTGENYPLICGHVHSSWAVKDESLNVGWDIWGRPLSEGDILFIYKNTDGFKRECKTSADLFMNFGI